MDYETLLYEQDDHVVTLTYNRPDQRNAVNRKMNTELHHAWQRFRDDDDAFVLVITGAGDTTFCAGWDLADAASLTETPDYEFFKRSIWNSPGECGYTRRVDIFKPVIAAVNGYAFAAGLETAMLADIRIAAENAEFGATERRWNIVGGDGMTVRLPLIVGYARAMEMIITGRRVGVQRGEGDRPGQRGRPARPGAARARRSSRAEIAALPQGAIRSDKESVVRGIGRTLEERLRIEAELDAVDVHAQGLAHDRRVGLQGEARARVAAPRPLGARDTARAPRGCSPGIGRFVFVAGSMKTWRISPWTTALPPVDASMRVDIAVSPRRVSRASKSTSSSNPAGPRKRTLTSATTMSVPASTMSW